MIDFTDHLADAIYAALPTTNRAQPTQLSADQKGERLAYAVSPRWKPESGHSVDLADSQANQYFCARSTILRKLLSILNIKQGPQLLDSRRQASIVHQVTRKELYGFGIARLMDPA